MAVQIQGQTGNGSYIANVDSSGNLYVTLSNSDIGGLAFVGTLSHNNAAPAASTQLGVLPAVASSGAPTYNADDQVLLSTDLSGNLRTSVNNTVTVSATSSANSKTNPIFIEIADGTNNSVLTAFGTAPATSTYAVGTNSQLVVLVSGTPTAVTGTGTSVNANITNSVTVTATNLSCNVNQWDGTALGAPSAQGTLQTVGNLISTNSEIFVGTTAVRSNQTTTATGAIDVNIVGSLGVTNSVTNGTFMAITDNTTKVGVIAGTTALKTDLSSVAGTATGTVASGVQKVGVADSAGNAFTSNNSTQSRSLDVNLVSVLGATMSNTNPLFSSITDGTTKAGVIVATTALKTDQSSWAGTALGTPTNFGTTPTAVIAGSVNASIFAGTTAVRSNQTTTATGVVDVNNVGLLGTTIVTAASGVQKVGIVGNAGVAMDAALGTAPTNALGTSLFPVTSGGCSTAVSQALTTTVNVKASAGQLYGYTLSNPNASVAYVEYYNTATTPGTIGATTNLILEVMIPAGATANVAFDNGIAFSSGIAVAVATTATGSTAPGIGLTITTIYK